jgi:hypothetical protein
MLPVAAAIRDLLVLQLLGKLIGIQIQERQLFLTKVVQHLLLLIEIHLQLFLDTHIHMGHPL